MLLRSRAAPLAGLLLATVVLLAWAMAPAPAAPLSPEPDPAAPRVRVLSLAGVEELAFNFNQFREPFSLF